MFNFLKKSKPPVPSPPLSISMREFLFGDIPLAQFPPPDTKETEEGLAGSAAAARSAILAGRNAEAERICRELLAREQESRVVAQLWHMLRSIGVQPQGSEIQVVGAVAEAGVNGGLDIVAAYRDGTARYFNYSDASVIWESPGADAGIAAGIDGMLSAAERVASFAGVHDAERPGPPPQDHVRITAVATDGLHFGQAPMSLFSNDPVAGPFLSAAIHLMHLLMEKGREGHQ